MNTSKAPKKYSFIIKGPNGFRTEETMTRLEEIMKKRIEIPVKRILIDMRFVVGDTIVVNGISYFVRYYRVVSGQQVSVILERK